MLAPEKLASYDVLVLNNNCSTGPRRNCLDELERNPVYKGLSERDRVAKSEALEMSVLDFVRGGKGIVVMHGGPTSQSFLEVHCDGRGGI